MPILALASLARGRKMGIDSLLNRYALAAKAEGKSRATIEHTTRVVGFFTDFLGGISDVRSVKSDDLRRFALTLQQKDKWSGRAQAKPQKITGTSVNTYVRGVKTFWRWLEMASTVPLLLTTYSWRITKA